MQNIGTNNATTTLSTAQVIIAPKVDSVVKNIFFVAIVALIALAVNM